MFSKVSMNMMVLLVAASLVGISSMYFPQTVIAQPQQLAPNTGQVVKQQRPPIVVQQPQQPQQQQQQQPLTGIETLCGPICVQAGEDQKLVDRLLPYIIKKIDGKTLAQKIDPNTLAAKVLPYLDITATVNERYGRVIPGSAGTVLLGTQSIGIHSDVRCNNNEQAVGGGFRYSGEVGDSMVYDSTPNGQNGWKTSAMLVEQNGSVQAFVTCLSINVGLKNVQQPQQSQQQPSPPPGGPPLQLPPNLR